VKRSPDFWPRFTEYNHLSVLQARINQELEHFLIVPYGMLYHEVTASSLLKVDMQGEVLDAGTTNLGINKAGFGLHAAIHAARPDIRCILHLQASSVIAVSWSVVPESWCKWHTETLSLTSEHLLSLI